MKSGNSHFVARIPDWFPTRKAAQVVAFFAAKAGGKINILRATKMVYLSDRASMAAYDHPITGDDFVSMKFGPVNTYTYSYMNGEIDRGHEQWAEFIDKRDGYDIPLAKAVDDLVEDLDELSPAELRVLEETWAEFKDIEKYELAEWTHKFCPEWRDPAGSSIPIGFATVFKRLEKPEPVELAEEIQAERRLAQMMAG